MVKLNLEFLYFFFTLLVTIFTLYKIITSLIKPNKNFPPSPPSLPIIGHLHLLRPPFHRTFHSWAQNYGPIFSLRLGNQPVIVVSSPRAVEECLSKHDIIFANRPNLLVGQILGYDCSMLMWAPHGPHWRNLRRIATLTTLSQKQVHLCGPDHKAEVRATIVDLIERSERGTCMVNLTEVFTKMMVNLLMRVIIGEPRETWLKPNSAMIMTPCDFIPVLKWVGYMGIEKELKRVKNERDVVLQSWIDEIREKRRENGEPVRKKTLIEDLLDLQDDDPDYYTDDILKGFILILLLAGSDTTAKTLVWAMSNLLNHPEILKKAKAEIDTNVDAGRIIDDIDVPKLNYIRCIIYETLRLFPPAPLLVPHYSSQQCTIQDYHIPKGTMLFVNAWALHKDPDLWDEPNVFKPERFESESESESEARGFKYMPFGIGRRTCPGNNFAIQTITLVLATLIQCFDWSTNDCGLVDLTEHAGSIVMPKEKPLYATCKVRSSMNHVVLEE